MVLSEKEVKRIRDILRRIETADKNKAKKHYYFNQARNIRMILSNAERREKDTLI